MLNSIAEVKDYAGVKSLSDLQRPRRHGFLHVLRWSSTVAAGSDGDAVEVTFPNDSIFICRAITFGAYLAATSGSDVAYTQLSRDSSNVDDANNFAPFSALSIKLNLSDYALTDGYANAALMTGDGRQPFYLPDPWIFGAGQVLRGSLQNNSAVGVQAEMNLYGARIRT